MDHGGIKEIIESGRAPGVSGASRGPGSGQSQIAYERMDVQKEWRLLGNKWEKDGTFEKHPGMKAQWVAKGKTIFDKPRKVVDLEERMKARDDIKWDIPMPKVTIGDEVKLPEA